VHETHGRLDVQPQMTHLVIDAVVRELQRQAEPGVVHEQIDGVGPIAEARDDAADAGLVDEVGCEHLDGHAVRVAQFGGQIVERRRGACDEHEVGAASGELAGELGAQPRAGSGDEGERHQRSYPRKR